jgi:hypothetical protein
MPWLVPTEDAAATNPENPAVAARPSTAANAVTKRRLSAFYPRRSETPDTTPGVSFRKGMSFTLLISAHLA